MGRISAVPLGLGALAGVLLLSGSVSSDPSTPRALPGQSAPFLGTAVIGEGELLAGVDPYGDLVDLRFPGPAGEAQIDNPFARQDAGSVPADTGLVPKVAVDDRAPKPLWRAQRVGQRYLRGTNVLRTEARIDGAAVAIEDSASGSRLSRRFEIRGRPGRQLKLRLDLNFDLADGPGGDSIARLGSGFVQHDGQRSLRCRGVGSPRVELGAATDPSASLEWSGRGRLRARLDCSFDARLPGEGFSGRAVAADRAWVAQGRPLGSGAPPWAQRVNARSLLVLRALTDAGSGASVAAARDHWAYVWPRDAGAAAIALAAAGYRPEARRIAGFLTELDLESGARFRGGDPVSDGRVLPGDAAGWVRAAAAAAGLPAPRPFQGAWRERGDYGERSGERGDFLANAIAGGARATEIKSLFAAPSGLQRRAGDPESGLDSAAAWAVRPFARPPLYPLARRSLRSIAAEAGRYGIKPSEDWPHDQAWTAPAAWSAWSLAALGDRDAALRLIATVRRAATAAGTIPERVDPSTGLPRSATPLGWSHAFAVLALRQLYPRR